MRPGHQVVFGRQAGGLVVTQYLVLASGTLYLVPGTLYLAPCTLYLVQAPGHPVPDRTHVAAAQ